MIARHRPSPAAPRPVRRVSSLRRWHRWCGLSLVAALLIAALSGSLLVYKKALIRLAITPDAALPQGYDTGAMARQLDTIAAMREHHAGLIKAPNREEPYWTLGNSAAPPRLLSADTLQPYQDNLWLLDALALVRRLHTELLAGLIGEALLMVSGIGGLFLAISGVMIWWPTRRSFRWRWLVPRPIPAQMLVHAHRHSGAASALVLTLVMFTGSLMLWQKLVRPILPPGQPSPLATRFAPHVPPSAWLRQAAAAVPDGWPTYIRLPTVQNPAGSVRFRLPGEWHPNGRTSVTFDLSANTAFASVRADQAPPARRLLNQMYPLHAGYGMGWLYATLIFGSGIATLWLGASGLASYLRRRS